MKGVCLCGGIQFEILGTTPNLYQCHCSVCRKSTGSSSNTATIVKSEQFRWSHTNSDIQTFTLQSGYRIDFCKRCGSPVPNQLRDKELVWIPAGLLENTELKVTQHIFVSSKAHWDMIGGQATEHEEMPNLEEFVSLLKC
ncbi:S-(hydroxymethyl)glutathione synthase [Pseudoalteromonas sp. A25]|uniref:GFA family protein n=1 Tax=Pseudoalteromonas sp. A25 TaxID=116092 RepID=UPI0012607A14|nr:GFA family protein [Pseudoalteromonas sp. A25]BBN82526.1 S-(hydroxymethyl)glutathione synthase [Pseudoalteromonas sp. A25]